MNDIMIGLDISKWVFQVHAEDGAGAVLLEKRLRRGQVEAFFAKLAPSRIGIEACGSAHHWGRTLRALGHEVRLSPAAYVKPFVRRNKTDARDAAAICAALSRPDMRFVPIKSVEQQASRGLERSRELLVKQHTQLMNCVRSQLAELGIVAAQGRRGFAALTARLDDGDAAGAVVGVAGAGAAGRSAANGDRRAGGGDHGAGAGVPGDATARGHSRRRRHHRACHRRRDGDGRQFGSARDFAAWAGRTPRPYASAGKRRDQGISHQGDIRLRKLFALGASTIMRNARSRRDRATQWQRGILARRPVKVAVLAQAAKTARIAWAILLSGETWQPQKKPPRPDPAVANAGALPTAATATMTGST